MNEGFTFVEVLLALTLSLVLAVGSWSLILVHSRGSVEVAATSDRLDATRVVRAVVEGELRGGVQGRDWTVFGRDSVALRAFRGVAVACGPAASGVVRVVSRGRRRPDPVKDSVLVLRPDGRWEALNLEDVRFLGPGGGGGPGETSVGPCTISDPPATLEEWTVPGLDGELLVARIFERGSYHLVDEALRYRTGAGGRQPVTQDLFDPRDSRMVANPSDPTALRIRLAFLDASRSTVGLTREMTLWLDRP